MIDRDKKRNINSDCKVDLGEIFLLSGIVSAIYMVLLLIKDVYPFGGNAFIFVSDGYQQNLSSIYYIWDVLHGEKALFFDFDVALGSNMAGMVSHFGMLSPINLLYLFIPRDYIIESTIWTLLLRIILSALSMRYLVRYILHKRGYLFSEKKHAKVSTTLFIIFISLAYAYSSWFMRYYMFFQWLDEAVILPICVRYLIGMLDGEERKCNHRYSVSLALMLILNIQQAYAILFFIVLFSSCHIITIKAKRHEVIWRLGLYTVIAVMISSFILLPTTYQVTHASRMGQGNIIYKIKQIFRSNSHSNTMYDSEKDVIISSMYLPLLIMFAILIFRGLKNFKNKTKIDKMIISRLAMLVIVILPVYIESIHYVWQGGEYIGFPLRYGEIICLTVLYILVEVLVARNTSGDPDDVKSHTSHMLSPYVLGGLSLLGIIAQFVIIGNMIYNHVSVGNYYTEKDMYYYGELLYDASLDDSIYTRYKNEVTASNTTLISGLSGNSNFMHLMSDEFIKTNQILGYEQVFTRLSDKGGTAFTDALLGYKYAITVAKEDKPDDIYTDESIIYDTVEVSELEVSYPFGIYIDKNIDIIDMYNQGYSLFEIQNAIYDSVIKDSEEVDKLKNTEVLFQEIDTDSDGKSVSFYIPEENDYITYVYLEYPEEIDVYSEGSDIIVNGSKHHYDRGIKPIYRLSGQVDISIEDDAILHVAIMDMDVLKNNIPKQVVYGITTTKNSVDFEIDNDSPQDRLLFFPLSDFEGENCFAEMDTENSIFDEDLDVVTVFGSYVGIIVPEGFKGKIHLEYQSPYSVMGLVISIIGFLLVLLESDYVSKKIRSPINYCDLILNSKLAIKFDLSNIVYYIFVVSLVLIVLGAYVLNILLYLWKYVMNIM